MIQEGFSYSLETVESVLMQTMVGPSEVRLPTAWFSHDSCLSVLGL